MILHFCAQTDIHTKQVAGLVNFCSLMGHRRSGEGSTSHVTRWDEQFSCPLQLVQPDTRLPCVGTLQPTGRAPAVKTAPLHTARLDWRPLGQSKNTKLPPLQAELEIHRSGAKKAKAKEGWMNREGGGFLGNSGGAGPPVKHEEKEGNRQDEMSKREAESLARETKPQISRTATEQEKMGNSSVLPPLSREQKLVAAIGPPPVAQVAPIPRVLQVSLAVLQLCHLL